MLTGAGGAFCAGADPRALSEGDRRPVGGTGPGPMGPTRLRLGKPVIAAIEGPAVAGGLELALWCDLRVAASDATLVNCVVEPGRALAEAVVLAAELAALPQRCLRGDRLSALEQWDLSEENAMRNEAARGRETIASGETLAGAARFAAGVGRHGARLAP